VYGMSILERPGTQVARSAMAALTSVRERGHPAKYLAGDRAYSSLIADDFQLPLRALGWEPVWDYKIDQLGVQGSHEGALLVDGTWYCPSIPSDLIEATALYRTNQIDEATWHRRLEARRPYSLRPKANMDDEGHQRLLCPAAGTAPTARCDLKPSSMTNRTDGKTRIFLVDETPAHAPKICTQASVTFPPEAGAKFRQPLPHGSPEWQTAYSTLRNTVEGFNGTVKDGAHEALADAQRRRVRGVAAQTVFTAVLIFGTNLRKIRSFCELAVVGEDGVARLPRRRRRTRSIGTWTPTAPKTTHDPPAAAS